MKMTHEQLDTLKELINIGVGRAASVLNEMVKHHVKLHVPFLKLLDIAELHQEMKDVGRKRIAAVRIGFKGAFTGTADLVFPPDSASKLVSVLTGEEPGTPDLDSVRTGTLSEVGNIVLNGVMGSIGNLLKKHIEYSLPSYVEDTLDNLLKSAEMVHDPTVLLVRTHFLIQQLQIEGDVILLFEVGSFDSLLTAVNTVNQDSGA